MAEPNDLLHEFDRWADALAAQLSPAARRKATTALAHELRKRQQQRIKAQQNPDGSPWEPRRPHRRERRLPNRALSFSYTDHSGKKSKRLIKSWADRGPLVVGWDIFGDGLRAFNRERMTNVKEVHPSAAKIRGRKMYTKLAMAKYLKAHATADVAEVGFSGRAAMIANVAQYGLSDRVRRSGPSVRYPVRQLLGFSDADREFIRDFLIRNLLPDA